MDSAAVRSHFPALAQDTVFLENAGGSHVPRALIDRTSAYFQQHYVQLGAGYPQSNRATEIVEQAHGFVSRLMNADAVGSVVLGPSTSMLCRMLADAYVPTVREGDEVVIAQTGHEANVGPWLRLQPAGAKVRWWQVDPGSDACPMAGLDKLLSQRTRLVILPHVSNLLGDIVDLAEVCRLAHAAGAQVVADGVAFAPHRAMDVAAWGVDWYVFSTYKVYGPHMAALFGTHEAFAPLEGPNHFFVPRDEVPYKWELGGPDHEGCAGLLGTEEYLAWLGGSTGPTADRATIERAFAAMEALELPAQKVLLDFLLAAPGVRVVGPRSTGPERVGTISFTHSSLASAKITAGLHARGIAMRHGHMYAHRLCEALDIEPEDGVVRISLVHYNTVQEAERCARALREVLAEG